MYIGHRFKGKHKRMLVWFKKHAKYIFVNNRPTAVVLDVGEYEMMKRLLDEMPVLYGLGESDVSSEIQKLADVARKMESSDFVNY